MAGRGSRPGERRGGRKKGTPNKLTATVKECFEQVFKDLQADPAKPYHLARWAESEPREFYKVAARLIPSEIKGEVDVKVTPKVDCIISAMVPKEVK